MDSLTWDKLRGAQTESGGTPLPLTLTEASASVKNSRDDCCAIANVHSIGGLRCESAHALFGCASVPVRVGEMRAAKPLAAAFAELLGAMIAGFIHARNCLAELFLGFYGCCVHGILHATRIARQGRELSGCVPLRQLCSRRCTQYTPGHRKLPPYSAPYRRPREYSPVRIFPFADRIG
jgi:hypothetical protein